MQNVITKNYLGNNIEFKMVEGEIYANATSMCKAFGKEVKNWTRLEQTQEYVAELKRSSDMSHDLISIKQGGKANEQGTWIHEKLILDLARWLNVKFRVWCDEQIATLLREGKIELNKKPLTPAQQLLMQAQYLVDVENRVSEVEKDVKRLEHNQRRIITNNQFTIIAYTNMKGISPKEYNSSAMGRKATKICKEEGLLIGKVVDSHYGLINTYPEEVLDRIFFE